MCWLYHLTCWGSNLYCKSWYCDCTCEEFDSTITARLYSRCRAAGKSSSYKERSYNLTCTENESQDCMMNLGDRFWYSNETGEISNSTFKEKYLNCIPKPTPTPKETPKKTLAITPNLTPIRTLRFGYYI